ncbi:DUF2512 family protein [Bacillus aerolatus]|uniref:DUF2512 family protein n=1 Tax=Bacillus aerolatus TaxID=2653354 RepID=A0A6I1FSS0_9BACI|nr:DUF2512 family protein [Bacillus aerolatus]KAB7707825.1 DUF2512 family protein [Bacillus aerolatus]
MGHVKALLIKIVMVTAILFIVLGLIFNMSMTEVLLTSLVVTGTTYLIGDLLIFRSTSNALATTCDFVLAAIMVYVMGAILTEHSIPLATAIVLSSIGIAIGEWFFHMYLAKNVFPKKDSVSHID